MEVLKDTKRTQLEIEKINENEEKAQMLLKLFEDDCKNWTIQYNKSQLLIKSYKLDALLTSIYVCYAGIFDYETRQLLLNKWISSLTRLNKDGAVISTTTTNHHHHHHQHTHQKNKFELKTPIQEEIDSHTNINLTTTTTNIGSKYSLRENFEVKDILINSHEYKDTIIQLNKLAYKDEHFINNSLLLREYCALPNVINWPVVFDPENQAIKVRSEL